MKKITLSILTNATVLFVLLFSINIFGQSASCEVEILAERDITIKEVSSGGAYYHMSITNRGGANDVFVLSLKDVNSSCSNVDGTSTANNIVLNYSFLDVDKKPLNEISLRVGESVDFLVSVNTPNNVNLNKWSCVEITASSKNCENYSANIILQSFVVNPMEGQ